MLGWLLGHSEGLLGCSECFFRVFWVVVVGY